MAFTILPAGTAIDEHGVTVSPWPLVHASGETALGVIEDIRETGSAVTPIIVGPAEDRRAGCISAQRHGVVFLVGLTGQRQNARASCGLGAARYVSSARLPP